MSASTDMQREALKTQLDTVKVEVGELRRELGADHQDSFTTAAAVSQSVMAVGQAILVAVIMLIVLGELYATDIVANPDNANAFTNMTTTFGDYGQVAFTMIGLGLIAAGASSALMYFGGMSGRK